MDYDKTYESKTKNELKIAVITQNCTNWNFAQNICFPFGG